MYGSVAHCGIDAVNKDSCGGGIPLVECHFILWWLSDGVYMDYLHFWKVIVS
jgi:hypothetical protein